LGTAAIRFVTAADGYIALAATVLRHIAFEHLATKQTGRQARADKSEAKTWAIVDWGLAHGCLEGLTMSTIVTFYRATIT